MKTVLITLSLFLSLASIAQEKVHVPLGDTDYDFEGIKSFENESISTDYYHVEDGVLKVYSVGHSEEHEYFSLQMQEVELKDLNFKKYDILDMNTGSTMPYKGWMLSIDTKKFKDVVKSDMRTMVDNSPGIDMLPSVSIMFNDKAQAEKVLEELKEASKK